MSIMENMAAAAEVILGREEAVQRLDFSSDGFYSSFKGVAVVGLIDGISLFATHDTRLTLEETPVANPFTFTLLALLVALVSYVMSMVALYLLCRTDELQKRFFAAVVLHNWAAPVVSAVFLVPFIVLLNLLVQAHPNEPGSLSTIILFASLALLIMIGVRLLRVSLALPVSTAFGFFAATAAVSLLIDNWLGNLLGLS